MNQKENIEEVFQKNNEQMSVKDKKQEKKRKGFGIAVEIVIYLLLLYMCAFFVPRYIIQRTIVDGDSMQTNYYDQENLIVEKVTGHFKEYNRFDVIVFYPKGNTYGDYYIKRVIGLPGERIQIKGNIIYINGEVLSEDYGKDPMRSGGRAEEEILLSEDEYFVLGDNRLISEDSRSERVGPVKAGYIAGKAIWRFWPFSRFGPVR